MIFSGRSPSVRLSLPEALSTTPSFCPLIASNGTAPSLSRVSFQLRPERPDEYMLLFDLQVSSSILSNGRMNVFKQGNEAARMDHRSSAWVQIRDGTMVKGGSGSVMTEVTLDRFNAAKMMSTRRTPKTIVTVILADLLMRMSSRRNTGTTTRSVSVRTSRASIICQRAICKSSQLALLQLRRGRLLRTLLGQAESWPGTSGNAGFVQPTASERIEPSPKAAEAATRNQQR